ncbi:hypothetical protein B9Z19DRAFT_1069010 [Tuber borchii]|uniref:Uncharacterized protein n=1 Tax=Tuber borchii TaxID=42251 RepID=A0A2T6ZD37_TUBBO|nr:hypothetical protein B9Z19DRAFT_1069010 [Tuber borchii]
MADPWLHYSAHPVAPISRPPWRPKCGHQRGKKQYGRRNFSTRLSEYISANTEKWDPEPRSVNRIESDPESSKHLETVATKILELDINFVSLRSEGYSEDGRIQQMEFGIPARDTLCLQYFTGLGIQEIAALINPHPGPTPRENTIPIPDHRMLICYRKDLGYHIDGRVVIAAVLRLDRLRSMHPLRKL